jgi:diaminohydroxyphosphoribosylaminopyrimidine deaminase/5-amino-6-(5-phosphoribosylamino)uracil reductase
MLTTEERFMQMAIRLAHRGIGRPSREPLAGAVIVADDRVVGCGYASERQPVPAIIAALDKAGGLASGATLYTNIEPCYDRSDEESCVRMLVECRLARVVVGATKQTQHSQQGNGILSELVSRRIEVDTGVWEHGCREVNEKYYKYSATGLPFVTVTFAQSLDGRIATGTGDSQWISGAAARRFAHQLRREHDVILVGIGTVLADDPRLTVRLVKGRSPLRIVVDSRLRIPLISRALANGAASHTLVVTGKDADGARIRAITDMGAEILQLAGAPNHSGVDLVRLFEELGRRGIASVLVEGGKGIITSLISARAVDRLATVIAPKLIGQGTEAIGDLGITRLNEAIAFSSVHIRRLGSDIIFDGRLSADDTNL